MKKTFLILAAAAILMTVTVCHANAQSDITGVDSKAYTKAEAVLAGASLIERDGFETEHIMTRGEFAWLISRSIIGENPQAETDNTVFYDVPGVYKYADGIRIAASAGVMTGYDGISFDPNREISPDEAVAALVKLSGYAMWAENNGGFPGGYYSVAADNNILKGVTLNGTVNYAQAVVMLKNTLDTDYVEISFSGGAPAYNKKDRSILSEIADVYEDKGKVTANSITSLYEVNGTGTDEIIIDIGKELLRISDKQCPADEYLGCDVEFAYIINDFNESELIYVQLTDRNNILELDHDEINDTTTKKKLSYTVGSRTKTANIETDAVTIYNGRYFIAQTDATYMPEYGSLKLIDNDSDGSYEVVFVWDFQALEITAIDRDYIYYNNGSKKYNYSDYTITDVKRNGKKTAYTSLLVGDIVLSAQSADGGAVTLDASDKKVNGTLNVIAADEITIDDKVYKLNPYFNEKLSVGVKYTFKLDSKGAVACTEETTDADDTYIFIISVHAETDSTEPILIKAYSAQGAISDYNCADKVRIDGVAYRADGGKEAALLHLKNASSVCGLNRGTYSQPARIKTDTDGAITEIDTVLAGTAGNLYRDKDGDGNNDLILSNASGTMHYYKSGLFQGRFVIDAKTILFNIPTDYRDFKSYSVMKMSDLKEQNYSVTAFNLNDVFLSDLVIITSESTSYEENFGMVSKIKEIYDSEYDAGTEIDILADGAEIRLKVFNENIIPPELEKGDLVRYNLNNNGVCTSLIRIFDMDADIGHYNKKLATTSGSGSYTSETRIAYGKALNREKNLFTLTYGEENDEEVYVAGEGPIMVYDPLHDTVERGTVNDISGIDQNGKGCDVVVYTRYAVVKAIAVYK